MIPNTPAHRRALANAEAAYEVQIAKARPMPGSRTGRRETDYLTAVRAAIAAWDKEMSN